MKNVHTFLLLLLGSLLFNCAGTYRSINPDTLTYPGTCRSDQSVMTGKYQYDILSTAGNKKYAKREDKSFIYLLALQITNTGSAPIDVDRDLIIYSGGKPVTMLSHDVVFRTLRQRPPLYLLYLPLTFLRLGIETATTISDIPIGLAIGPGLTIGNVAVASFANTNFRNNLRYTSLQGVIIEPGETVSGIIAIPKNDFAEISLGLMID